jgi:hypothetical protein
LAFLEGHFPTIPADSLSRIFPLLDALDLDVIVRWTIPSSDPALVRSGYAFLHGVRLAPESSVVEDLRREVDAAIAGGGKQTRTMYEETGRLRRVLMDSVLDGVLSREEDPVVVRLRVDQAKRGVVQHDFGQGWVVLSWSQLHAGELHTHNRRACTIKVYFLLRNRSPIVPVRWVLRLSDSPSGPRRVE